jgi:hypothetical protein
MISLTVRVTMTAIRQLETEPKQRRRRKPPIHTASTPIKRLALKRERRARSVYILARPMKRAGYLGILTGGKFPLCHWAVLVSPHNQREFRDHSQGIKEIDCWGTMFEISADPHKVQVLNVHEYFAQHFTLDGVDVRMAYIGKTHLPDYRISHHGTS